MKKPIDGGPAFPTLPEHGFNDGMPGMSLRDYFAAKAMQGYIVGADMPNVRTIAEVAYMMADAMLKARGSAS